MMSTTTALPQDRQRLGWLVAGVLGGVLAVTALAPAFVPTIRAADDETPSEHTITVLGTGRILLRPDLAELSLGITIQRPRAREAEATAAEAMQRVLDALERAGIADADIQTAVLSLQPLYDWERSGPPRITGYQMDHLVSVTVRDLARVGEAVDAAVDAGATSINGITFRVDDPAAAEQRARAAAVEDARSKADSLARAGDVNIVGVLSITEASGSMPVPFPWEAAGEDRAATPARPGNVELTVTVSVVYEIG